jgi:uncharacterized protein YbcI
MKTHGEIEAAACKALCHFSQEFTGRGPKSIRAYLNGDLLVIRLQGVLTAIEQHIVKTDLGAKGRGLLKQVRLQLIEMARPILDAMIREVTGVKVLSLHHDISTITGEEIVVFTLTGAALPGEKKFRETPEPRFQNASGCPSGTVALIAR